MPWQPGAEAGSVGVSEAQPLLNLGAWEERSRVNGPGERFVLWVQGCPLLCPGCVNEDYLPFAERHVVRVEEMADHILAVPGIEGVTYTGGEPTAQAHALALLSRRVRSAGLSVVCYTGYTIEAIRERRDPWVEQLVGCVDILIDGPYAREQAASLLWRGSRNQRLLFLTDRYRHLASELEGRPAEVEFTLRPGRLTVTGTWPEGLLDRLKKHLED